MTINKIHSSLSLAGTLPFIACALLPLADVASVPVIGSLDEVASSYGLVIVCFMAGTHWGIDLSRHEYTTINLLVSSNAIALFVWFAYLGASVTIAIACQVIAFLLLLAIDHRLRASEIISSDYFQIRLTATAIVTVAMITVVLT